MSTFVTNLTRAYLVFEGKPIGSGKAGQLTKRLLVAYKELVSEALGRTCPDKYYGIKQELCEERKVSIRL